MTQTKAILAALGYLKDFRTKPIVLKLDESALGPHRAEKRLVSDILLLKELGLRFVLVCNDEAISSCSKLLKKAVEHVNLESLILGTWPKDAIPVVAEPIEQYDQLAAEIAVQMGAGKLIFLSKNGCLYADKTLIHEITVSQAEELVPTSQGPLVMRLKAAVYALRNQVPRVHMIGSYDRHPNSLIGELFTPAGVGTMIFLGRYKEIVKANPDQTQATIEFLQSRPMHFSLGSFVDEGASYSHWWVSTTDEEIDGCLKLTFEARSQKANIVCLAAANEDFETLKSLIVRAFEESRKLQARYLTLDFANHPSWVVLHPIFSELGFRQQSEKSRVWIARLTN